MWYLRNITLYLTVVMVLNISSNAFHNLCTKPIKGFCGQSLPVLCNETLVSALSKTGGRLNFVRSFMRTFKSKKALSKVKSVRWSRDLEVLATGVLSLPQNISQQYCFASHYEDPGMVTRYVAKEMSLNAIISDALNSWFGDGSKVGASDESVMKALVGKRYIGCALKEGKTHREYSAIACVAAKHRSSKIFKLTPELNQTVLQDSAHPVATESKNSDDFVKKSQSDYCTNEVKTQCGDKEPSVCMLKNCDNIESTSAGDTAFRERCLDRHNIMRSRSVYHEFASNMMELKWSAELEYSAMRWAHQLCIQNDMQHDTCRSSPSFKNVGQNLFRTDSTEKDNNTLIADLGVESWYEEVPLGDHDEVFPLKRDKIGDIGHLTQMLWANTDEVGCAVVMKNVDQKHVSWLVCNYAPAGNIIGANIFITGSPASHCPSGTRKSEKYPKLCRK